jgi:hypothetical protein
MRTDLRYVLGSVLLTLVVAVVLAGAVWAATGSWNYAGGTGLFALEAVAPLAAWLVDRVIAG